MTQSWNHIVNEMVTGSLSMAFNLIKILIVIMIFVQIFLSYGMLDKLVAKLGWLSKFLGVSKAAVFPIIIAAMLGVTYGAGTLMELEKTNPLSKRDLALVGAFMFACHGVIETTIVLGAAGANIWIIGIGRLCFALVITAILARTLYRQREL